MPPDGILASFPRDGSEGEPAALRVMLSEFNGRLVLQLRQWVQAGDRRWIPTKAGNTIRLGEVDRLIAALQRAKLAMMDAAAERSTDATPSPVRPAPEYRRERSAGDSGLRDVPPWER